jgi:hypothetical protein
MVKTFNGNIVIGLIIVAIGLQVISGCEQGSRNTKVLKDEIVGEWKIKQTSRHLLKEWGGNEKDPTIIFFDNGKVVIKEFPFEPFGEFSKNIDVLWVTSNGQWKLVQKDNNRIDSIEISYMHRGVSHISRVYCVRTRGKLNIEISPSNKMSIEAGTALLVRTIRVNPRSGQSESTPDN